MEILLGLIIGGGIVWLVWFFRESEKGTEGGKPGGGMFGEVMRKASEFGDRIDATIRVAKKQPGNNYNMPVSEQIAQLWRLKQEGAITQEEFDEQKARLLRSIGRRESEDARKGGSNPPVKKRDPPRTSREKPASKPAARPSKRPAAKPVAKPATRPAAKPKTKPEVSIVPTMNDFMRPILQWASVRLGRFTLHEATDAMSDYFNLSTEARRELTGGGNVEKVYDRTNWSVSHLKHAGLLRQRGRGYYEITDEGNEEVLSSNEVISPSYLLNKFPSYRRWKQSGSSEEKSEVPTMNNFMRPILEYANQCPRSFNLREAADAMADHFNLSGEARNELTGGGNIDRVYDRTNWSVSHLKHAELLRQRGRGYYEITDVGREELLSSHEITTSYLIQNVPAYQRWRRSKRQGEES